ncbi:hypothetical protein JOQ06_007174 [Pogonophryne albipinna]|uniref:Uncharacterized protein n=1 Tax=Pogonophryne albipinna TaxID=1090488 RepID=A0AAD6FHR7_9TELE|nr:hypothetical protein JOQ06_007174 [Pogonophryne albipinna]
MFMVKCDMVEALEFARACQKMFHAQHMKSNRTSKEHEETRFLTEILHTQRMEIEKVKKDRNMEQDHFNDMKRYFNNILIIFDAEGCVIQREISKMKTVQQEIEKKVSQVIQEKEDEITRVREEMSALVKRNLESLAKVRAIDTKVRQIETVKKEESLRKTQEVWKQIREMEEEWLNKEEEWFNKEEEWLYKESRMEKEGLTLKTDKVKEKGRITYFLPI